MELFTGLLHRKLTKVTVLAALSLWLPNAVGADDPSPGRPSIVGKVVEISDQDVLVIEGDHRRFIMKNFALTDQFQVNFVIGKELYCEDYSGILSELHGYHANAALPVVCSFTTGTYAGRNVGGVLQELGYAEQCSWRDSDSCLSSAIIELQKILLEAQDTPEKLPLCSPTFCF